MNALCQGDEIKKLIPQREPIIQVDSLFERGETHACCGLTISSDNIFCRQGYFTEPGLIEHIAQSAATMLGYKNFSENKPASIGYISEIKKMQIAFLPKVGDCLQTKLEIISEVENLSLLKAETFVNDNLVANCQMKIFIKQ